jgi:hypothetical protein
MPTVTAWQANPVGIDIDLDDLGVAASSRCHSPAASKTD